MSKKKIINKLFRSWLAPGMCLVGLGMVLSIVIPFWIWVLVAGIGLIGYGLWSYFC